MGRIGNVLASNLLCVLDDCITQHVDFALLPCQIFKNLLIANSVHFGLETPRGSLNKEIDSTIIVNLISILQEITDDQLSHDILSALLENKNDPKQTVEKWTYTVVPLAEELIRILGR